MEKVRVWGELRWQAPQPEECAVDEPVVVVESGKWKVDIGSRMDW